MTSQRSPQARLHLATQLAYGAGDLGPSMAGNVLMVFFFFFLTSVAGLSPQQAGTILLLSNAWSALSTLFVGVLSDRTQTRWGRRRIWMLASAPILAISFCLHWWVPPTAIGFRCAYYLAVALLFQTAANTFLIPYGALVADLSDDDGDRVRLTSLRFCFSLAGCIGSLLLAQTLAQHVYLPSQQLFDLGAICALVTVGSIAVCCWRTNEQPRPLAASPRLHWRDWQALSQNRPLLFLIGLYGLSWLALQITPALLPYFVVHCLDLDSTAIARVVLIVQGSALVALFLWEQIARQLGRKLTYWLGTSLWILADLSLLSLDADRAAWVYALAALAGAGMATTYLIPPSMLPEVADWDELHTGQRREGLFYSLLLCLQKLALAVGLFLVGQLLTWSGFQAAVPGPVELSQPDSALATIRAIAVFLPAIALTGSLLLAHFYPLHAPEQQATLAAHQEQRKLAGAA